MVLNISDFMTEHRFIILTDIRDYSELSDNQQVQVIQTVTKKSKEFIKDGGYEEEKIFSSFIATGDGFYLVGHEMLSLIWSGMCLIFAVSLRNELLKCFKSFELPCQGIKIAIHFGTTMTFTDIAGTLTLLAQE